MKTLLLFTVLLALISKPMTAQAGEQAGLKEYLEIQTLLAADTFTGVIEAAKKFEKSSKSMKDLRLGSLAPLISAKDIKEARVAFEPISRSVRDWVKVNKPNGLVTAYCPMKKAYWAQKKGDLANPFYGKEMLECGVVE